MEMQARKIVRHILIRCYRYTSMKDQRYKNTTLNGLACAEIAIQVSFVFR